MNLDSARGSTASTVQTLWSRPDATGLAPAAPMNAAPRLLAQFGYGFSGRKPDRLWHPYVSAQATAEAGRLSPSDSDSPSVRMRMRRRGWRSGAATAAIQARSTTTSRPFSLRTGSIRW